MKNGKTKKIVLTGLFLALLVVVQYITKPMGQLVTGACVNFVLIAATLLSGLWSSLIVALASPFLAFALGIGPQLLPVIPAVAVSNAVICLAFKYVFYLNDKNIIRNKITAWCIAVAGGALLKFCTIYLLAVKLVLPMLSQLPSNKVAALSAAFGVTQLVTAALGGIVAAIIIPLIKKGIDK